MAVASKKLGEAFVEIRARMGRLKPDLDKAKNAIAKFLQNAQSKLDSLGTRMVSAGRNISAGLSLPLAALGATLLRFAGQAEETENLVRVVFEDMASEAFAFAEAVKKSMGLSRIETQRNVATLQTMLLAMGVGADTAFEMSKALTVLAGDISSFREDISRTEAFVILRSALSKEFEPLKRLGVVLNDARIEAFAFSHGIATAGKELTEAQIALSVFGLVMDKTKKLQGDLARTQLSFSNQVKTLGGNLSDAAAVIGKQFLPLATALLITINRGIIPMAEWIARFMEAHPILTKIAQVLAAVLIVVGPLVLGIGLLAKGIAVLIPIVTALWTAFLGPIGLVIAGITAVIGLVTALFGIYGSKRAADVLDAKESSQAIVDAERKKMADLAALQGGADFRGGGSSESLGLFGRGDTSKASVNPFASRGLGMKMGPQIESLSPRQIDASAPAFNAKPMNPGGDKSVSLLQQVVDELRAIRDQTMSPAFA